MSSTDKNIKSEENTACIVFFMAALNDYLNNRFTKMIYFLDLGVSLSH